MAEVRLGKYKHFKGFVCDVIGVARYSEDPEQQFVVYYHNDADGVRQLWVRPLSMFLETVELNGALVPRFEYISE